MKIKNYIFQAVSIVMLLCVFTTQVTSITTIPQTESTSTDDSSDEQTTLKQHSQESVVPNYNFSFGEMYGFLASYVAIFAPVKETSTSYGVYFPANTYFDKLFEHHIAINAP